MGRLKWAALVLAVSLAVAGIFQPFQVSAQVAAPALTVQEARCYRSIVQTDDALCLLRYHLQQRTTPIPTPLSGTPQAWCVYLQNTAGCGSNPTVPEEPTSLQFGVLSAWLTVGRFTSAGNVGFIPDPAASTGSLYYEARAPRIFYALGGAYFANTGGGGLTWGDTSVRMCVESTDDFSPMAHACSVVSWNAEANTQTAQRAALSSGLRVLLRAVSGSRGLPENAYVSADKIVTAGAVLALEAYPYMDRVIPDAFQAAAETAVQTPYSGTPAGVVLLATQIAGTQAASNFLSPAGAGSELLGSSGGMYSTLLWGIMGMVTAAFAFMFTKSIPITVIAFASVTFMGVFTGGPTLSVIGVVLVILGLLAGLFMMSRVPQ